MGRLRAATGKRQTNASLLSPISIGVFKPVSLRPSPSLCRAPSLSHSLSRSFTHSHTNEGAHTLSAPAQPWHLRSLSICVSPSQGIPFPREARWKTIRFEKTRLDIHCLLFSFAVLPGRALAEENASKRWVRLLNPKNKSWCAISHFFLIKSISVGTKQTGFSHSYYQSIVLAIVGKIKWVNVFVTLKWSFAVRLCERVAVVCFMSFFFLQNSLYVWEK